MHQMLTQLKLARIREIHQEWFDRAAETQMPYPDFLRGLLQEELLAREENQLRRRLKDAGFPFEKTLDDFDFRLRPELNRQVFLRYLDERFITQGRALVLVGPTGLGKTHLSVAVGLALLKRGYTVRFTTVQALLTRVLRAPGLDGRARVLKPYHASDVLILDEWGYLPADPDIGPILYEVIATRYEKKATLITSNKSLTEWGRVLHDTALAAALVDRLLHHGEVYYLKGDSYRLRGKPRPAEAPATRPRDPRAENWAPSPRRLSGRPHRRPSRTAPAGSGGGASYPRIGEKKWRIDTENFQRQGPPAGRGPRRPVPRVSRSRRRSSAPPADRGARTDHDDGARVEREPPLHQRGEQRDRHGARA
jgi:DNA replication protein DnaC